MDNNNQDNSRITQDNVPTQTEQPAAPADNTAPATPEQGQASPVGPSDPTQTTDQPDSPAQPTEPVAPAAPVDPTPPAPETPVAPQEPVAPAAPQQPTTPPPSPAVTTTQNLGTTDNPNLQPSPAAEQPTKGAYIPQSMNSSRVAREETYQEDMLQKAHSMRDILRVQPKVWAMVPLQPGEKPGTMLPVGINGYFIYIKKGVMVQVPQQIGEIVSQSFNLDYDNGAEFDLSKNEDKQRALS